MLAARASAVIALAACGWALVNPVPGQQPAGTILPVSANFDAAAAGPGKGALSRELWMPSRVAGNLADRLQALHEPLSAASQPARESADSSQLESAARTPPAALAHSESRPLAAAPVAAISARGSKPPTSSSTQISIVEPRSAATQSAAQRHGTSRPPAQAGFGSANPLRAQ
ncbi:MAG TPA: hypothetical protein VHY20_06550 [Pirellulales bacterium]|jgi:hypothetical protein|nr:hypothetical protein [Pirellulales bacterium]